MGKGDTRRPTQIDDKEFTNNWCATFGHKVRHGVCINTGCTYREDASDEQPTT